MPEEPKLPLGADEIRRSLLRLVAEPGYRPAKPRTLALRLGLGPESAHLVRRTVRDMARVGEIVYGANHLVLAAEKKTPRQPSTKYPVVTRPAVKSEKKAAAAERRAKKPDRGESDTIRAERYEGTFRRLASGGGIVRLFPTGRNDLATEFFIPRHLTSDAANGDTVEVQRLGERVGSFRRHSDDSTPMPADRGRILRIVKRDVNRFVGTYRADHGQGSVEVDGNVFKRGVKVGDASAIRAADGDKVVLEMTHFPCHFSRGEGVVVEVLGRRGEPGLDTKLIMRQYELPEQFPPKVLREARDQVYEFDRIAQLDDAASEGDTNAADALQTELAGRTDLTNETVITIDPLDARDFDDAVSLTRTEKKGFKLGVHIADVAHFVRPGTALDAEALRRGTSVYLPDRVIPMLPEVISNALASLQPGRVRLTKTVLLEFSPTGILTDVEIVRSFIRSRQRLAYEEADAFLADPTSMKGKLKSGVGLLLKRMATLAEMLHRRRLAKGAIELDFPDLRIVLDDDGRVSGAVREESTPARHLIEEFMLAANRAVAEFLTTRDVPFLRRIHAVPSPAKLEQFAAFVRSLGFDSADGETFAADRFAIQNLLNQVRGTADSEAVQYALLRSMPKAVYSPNADGHFALAMENYTHFTSPIRRYPDLTVHHLLDRLLDGGSARLNRRDLVPLGQRLSQAEQHAEEAERELKKLKLIEFMRENIGKTMIGVVTGVERFGFFVRGREIPAEGLVRIDTLSDDYYHYDSTLRILTGFKKGNIIKIGDEVTVEIRRADTDARQLDFLLAQKKTAVRKGTDQPAARSAQKRPARKTVSKRGKK